MYLNLANFSGAHIDTSASSDIYNRIGFVSSTYDNSTSTYLPGYDVLGIYTNSDFKAWLIANTDMTSLSSELTNPSSTKWLSDWTPTAWGYW